MNAFITRTLFISGLILLTSGCGSFETNVKVDKDNELYLSNFSVSSGGNLTEVFLRHTLNILGNRDSFKISKYVSNQKFTDELELPSPSVSEDIAIETDELPSSDVSEDIVTENDGVFVESIKPYPIKKINSIGDKIQITQIDKNRKKFVWRFEPRAQLFPNKNQQNNSSSPFGFQESEISINITFPGSVEFANSPEGSVNSNVYTWRIKGEQLNKPYTIQAIYSTP